MEIRDDRGGISEILCRLPRALSFVEALPVHEVVQIATQEFGIQHRSDFLLRFAVHDDRRRLRHVMARKMIHYIWL